MSRPFEPISFADIIWRDNQPYSIALDDTYYSKDNPIHHALEVFIDGNQLIQRWQALSTEEPQTFIIAETGFGGGLHFLLSWLLWRKHAPLTSRLHYLSCEQHPLTHDDLSRCLRLWPQLHEVADLLFASYPVLTPGSHSLVFDEGRITLNLMLGDPLECYRELLICGDPLLENQLRTNHVDAWFLNGFSPEKNPEIWRQPLFNTIAMLSKKNTTLATGTLANFVKNGLQSAGFLVRNNLDLGFIAKFDQANVTRSPRATPWHASIRKRMTKKNAIVIGAGLAGCYTANALARRGWEVAILDANGQVGEGASGNHHAVLYPKLSSFYSPLNAFMLSSYLFALRSYQYLSDRRAIGNLSGILQLAYNQKEQKVQDNLRHWLSHYPKLARLVDVQEATEIAGVPLSVGGLFLPHSGSIDSPKLCQRLIESQRIQWIGETNVSEIIYDQGMWHANDHHAEVLIIANGYCANQFAQTKHLPLKAIHGQMSFIMNNACSARIKLPLCADGHIIPAENGVHALGATFNLDSIDNQCFTEDDEQNLAKLKAISTDFEWPSQIVGHWSGIRTAAPDYLPLVGPVADALQFIHQFSGLSSDSNRWIPLSGPYHEGLYISTGFGSRGLTTVPLSAEWLAAKINNEPSLLSRTMEQSISPARFLRRSIIRPKTSSK